MVRPRNFGYLPYRGRRYYMVEGVLQMRGLSNKTMKQQTIIMIIIFFYVFSR